MKHKLSALLLALALNGFLGSNEAHVQQITKVAKEKITLSDIVVSQLERLLIELQHDENIVEFLKKYPNAEKHFGKEERSLIRKIAEKIARINNAETDKIERGIYITIQHESNFNPKAVNKLSQATGIIQWLPSTAKKYNTTVEDIYKMSVLDQLNLMEQYLTNCANKYNITSEFDVYLAVFNPSSIGKPGYSVIGKKGSVAAIQNAGVDRAGNNDGVLTVSDVKQWLS